MLDGGMELVVPADVEYSLAVGLAVDGLCMKAGLNMELLADLRTLCSECLDVLCNQAFPPRRIRVHAALEGGRFHISFLPLREELHPCGKLPLSLEITRGILETLMPEVLIDADSYGICGIQCSMPV